MIEVSLTAWANLKRANQGLADLCKSKSAMVVQIQRTNTSLLMQNSKLSSENEELKEIIADQNKELLEFKARIDETEYVHYAD